MIKKTDVYDFIDKVQTKAINSVREKYDLELASVIEATLNDPANLVLKNALKQVELSTKTGREARDTIKKHIPRFDNWGSYFNDYNFIKDAFGNDRNFPQGFDNIQSVHVEYQEKIRRIKEEYTKIMQVCKNKKTGDQGRTALIALGFDVTWLNNLENLPVVINEAEFKIDKSLVFPCGESGV